MHQLKLIFVHVHLWTLEIPNNDIQVQEHVIDSEIPLDHTEARKVLDLGNCMWKLEASFEKVTGYRVSTNLLV
ncbi:hypothetical protein PS15m_007890 [Mucor circinelloides]